MALVNTINPSITCLKKKMKTHYISMISDSIIILHIRKSKCDSAEVQVLGIVFKKIKKIQNHSIQHNQSKALKL